MPYICETCHKELKNRKSLEGHIAKFHPVAGSSDSTPEKDEKSESEAQVLEVKAPHAQKYECADCGAPIRRGQSPCPKCGTVLAWEGL